jgi:DNA-directed RNA polymerase subunit RPC12/RpoP
VTLSVGSHLAGKLVACPKCKQRATVPTPLPPLPPEPIHEPTPFAPPASAPPPAPTTTSPFASRFTAAPSAPAKSAELPFPALPPLPPDPQEFNLDLGASAAPAPAGPQEFSLDLGGGVGGDVGHPTPTPPAATYSPPPPPPPPPDDSDVELVDDEEEEELIRFPCMRCGVKLKVGASKGGQGIECPKCGQRTMVPEANEIGTFIVRGVKKGKHARTPEPPLAAWWPDGKKLNLPSNWRVDLEEAREYAQTERWQRALNALHDLQKSSRGDGVDIDVLRKPLAYCLAKWAAVELDRINRREKLSKPLRKVFKTVESVVRWGGQMDTHVCAACGKPMEHLVGSVQIRTAAGSAYMCCAAPTGNDDALIRQVQAVAKKLTLATGLDPDSGVVADAMELLPSWYRAVDLSGKSWAKTVEDTSGEGGGGAGGLLGSILGDALGDVLGDLLS